MSAILVNAGLAIITNRIIGNGTPPNNIGWGTGTTAAAATDTALQTPSAEARVAATQSQVTTTVTNDTYQIVGTITSASAQTISEFGAFDAAVAGNMFIHDTFTGLALNVGDAIQFTEKVQL